ncbi:hypothetical protein NPIL_339801 [Nephila pilipes]|uniref:Uncharacterized protein n=1 Tax=Nephila pilipes TaxID=299642 RepID=A0A8X6J120_NEPPI|nr:hypothetical protein NPIL_339801 [Nephila pilipes]
MPRAARRRRGRNLRAELHGLSSVNEIYLSVAGNEGVGKSTLVQRLEEMDRPPYDAGTEIIKSNYKYMELRLAYVSGSRRNGRYLLIFQFDPPPLPVRFPQIPIYVMNAVLFCMDVLQPRSISAVVENIFFYRLMVLGRIPPGSLMVGTKIDFRDEFTECLSRGFVQSMSNFVGINRSVECSAWSKRGMRLLLYTILHILRLWQNN